MTLHINSIFGKGKTTLLTAALALSSVIPAMAQEELNQEITVKHHEEVKPTDAVKLNVSPEVSLPALPSQRLSYGMRQIKVGVPTSISSLAPAAYADTIYRSPFRGYASAGYLPAFNLGASAGYKFIDNDRVRLNGWMQYNGSSYRADNTWLDSEGSSRLRRNVATIGAALHSAVGRDSYLDLGLDYTFARFNTPGSVFTELPDGTAEYRDGLRDQNVHRLNAQGLWTMTTGKWNTALGLSYGHFAYGNHILAGVAGDYPEFADPLKPVRENKIAVSALASAAVWGAQSTGMELRFSYLTYGNHASYSYIPEAMTSTFLPQGSFSHGLLSLRPFYRTTWKRIDVDLGLNLDFTFNCGRAFHISPAAQATWKPSNFVTLYVKANGGERQNTLGSLFDVSYYGLPNMAYGNSHIVLDGEVGVTVGLFKGFYSQISAGYAVANDWLMPSMTTGDMLFFEKINMKGYKFHFGLGYRYRNLIDLSGSFEMAPQKINRGYYLWRDRARYVTALNLRVTPMEQLDINLGWEYRGGRKMGLREASAPESTLHSMGLVNSLNLGAAYRINTRWTVWADVDNLLNHHYTLIGGLPSQGIGGLIGVTYKF